MKKLQLLNRTALSIATFLSLLGSVSGTQAAEGRWTEGSGQGNREFFIDSKGWQLRVNCPTKDGSADSPSSVAFTDLRTNNESKKFTIRAGGITFQGPFAANSRVGNNNFLALLEGLHASDATVTHGSGVVTFPKSNAAKVVPVFGKTGKGFVCNLD
jgi:hypothetical protein